MTKRPAGDQNDLGVQPAGQQGVGETEIGSDGGVAEAFDHHQFPIATHPQIGLEDPGQRVAALQTVEWPVRKTPLDRYRVGVLQVTGDLAGFGQQERVLVETVVSPVDIPAANGFDVSDSRGLGLEGS